jgi:predicted nucleic acid-binding protein
MAVVVFDTDVLIGFRHAGDAHHDDAVECVRRSFRPGIRRLLSVVNYTELLIGPLRAGGLAEAESVDAMLAAFAIETVPVDVRLAQRAAAVRAQTNLKLPDAYAIATAVGAERHGAESVAVESFDERVIKAYAQVQQASA